MDGWQPRPRAAGRHRQRCHLGARLPTPHHAPVRFVHYRDLKPSDMTAVVANFGIIRLVKDVGDGDLGGNTGEQLLWNCKD